MSRAKTNPGGPEYMAFQYVQTDEADSEAGWADARVQRALGALDRRASQPPFRLRTVVLPYRVRIEVYGPHGAEAEVEALIAPARAVVVGAR
jgi:hypothetical protein